jgi:serine/threonine-protein kinase
MLPAARLGRYEVLAKLASGGMGEILLARLEGAAGFEKLCVIKRILPHLASEPRFRAMMIVEAQIVSRINHANVCQIHELGEIEGELYMVMEYLEGVTLLELLQRFAKKKIPLEPGLIVGILCQIADGLHYAHELKDREGKPLNIVHRDIAPSNVFITDHGVAKVLDFGIAKVANVANTESGAVKGKYAYMAPEQLHGWAVDRRADVFSLGILVFEMLALRRLFQRKTDYLTFHAILDQPIPDVRQFRNDVPPGLLEVMERCLKSRADERFATARQFRAALVAGSPAQPWGDNEIGDFIMASFADDIRKRSRNVGAILDPTLRHNVVPTIGRSSESPDVVDYFTPAIEIEDPQAAEEAAISSESSSANTVAGVPKSVRAARAPRHPRAWWWAIAAAAAAVITGVTAFALVTRKPHAPVDDRAATTTTDPYALAVHKRQAELDGCVHDHGTQLPPYARVRVFVEPSGATYQLAVEPAAAADEPMMVCIRKALSNVSFPTAAGRREILIALTVR